ncbi:unnamed protein product [Soboliphyme baturini]|uniref:Uncharacterized protein n=1 Tax=Soboliphyme baturini TaxID=241478 RepID=A0A183J717_9BILA|nr:unnamed protein product [Soboliphyme baturini]
MAKAGDLCPTDFNAYDAAEFTKRYLFNQREQIRIKNSQLQQENAKPFSKKPSSLAGKTDIQTLFTDPSAWRTAFEQRRQELIDANRLKYLQRQSKSDPSEDDVVKERLLF